MNLNKPLETEVVTSFLDDYLANSQIEIVMGAKQSELIKLAQKKGIVTPCQDLGFFKNIYAFSDEANANGARLPDNLFQRALPTIIMKPVNVGHKKELVGYSTDEHGQQVPMYRIKRTPVVGVYFDYVYKAKEKLAITYGAFFKSIYPEIWEEAQKFLKKGKLKSSYEVWCPKEKKEQLPDGTRKLNYIEFAGGSLLFDDPMKYPGQSPAFEGAKVLELARKNEVFMSDKTLEFASIDSDDIIVANTIPTPPDEPQPEAESNVDFRITCLECNNRLTKVVKEEQDSRVVHCELCNKHYEIDLVKLEKQVLEILPWEMQAKVGCPQCQTSITFSYNPFKMEDEYEVNCVKCKLTFPAAVPTEQRLREVQSIREIVYEENPFDSTGLIIDDTEKVNSVCIANKENEINAQEDEVTKENYYKVLRKTVSKSRDLSKNLNQIELASQEKVEKLEKKVKRACGKIVKAQEKNQEITIASSGKYPRTGLVREAIKQLQELKQSNVELASKVEETEKQVNLYRENAQTIVSRRTELGDFAKDLSDTDLLDEKNYEIASLKKELTEIKTVQKPVEVEIASKDVQKEPVVISDKTASKTTGDGYYTNPQKRAEMDRIAFGE